MQLSAVTMATMPTRRRVILAEVSVFVAFALLSRYAMSLIFWRFAGPVSLLLTLLVLTLYLRARGSSWRAFGLHPPPSLRAKLMIVPQMLATLAAFALVVAITTLGLPALGLDFMARIPAGVEDRWGDVAGSLPHYLLWLTIVWTAAAFGEEMFFRGYLVSRLQQAFGSGWASAIAAVVISALIFGYGHHYYQGLRGAIVTGGIGLAFGAMFLLWRRNLWPLVLLHGIIDTLTFTAIFRGWN